MRIVKLATQTPIVCSGLVIFSLPPRFSWKGVEITSEIQSRRMLTKVNFLDYDGFLEKVVFSTILIKFWKFIFPWVRSTLKILRQKCQLSWKWKSILWNSTHIQNFDKIKKNLASRKNPTSEKLMSTLSLHFAKPMSTPEKLVGAPDFWNPFWGTSNSINILGRHYVYRRKIRRPIDSAQCQPLKMKSSCSKSRIVVVTLQVETRIYLLYVTNRYYRNAG